MSGFVHPSWSGFSSPEPPASSAAGDPRQVAGHEIDRLMLGNEAAQARKSASGEASPEAPPKTAPPQPVTPASPGPHKALTP